MMVTGLEDLPEDILSIIFSSCEAKDFLAVCRTCKSLYSYRQDATYWRTLTSKTFRLPISPLLKADGARWYYLYKRLKTQTRLYTWGQGLLGGLGQGRSPLLHHARGRILRAGVGRMGQSAPYNRASSSWPTETHLPDEIKVIADMQCGGWSTSILSSDGNLYVTGIIDSMDGRPVGESTDQFRKLEYLTQSTSAIRQFSAGRRHILAVTDDNKILSWDRINAKGMEVLSRTGQNLGSGSARVIAGWAISSAYIPDIGIVYWMPITNELEDQTTNAPHISEIHVSEIVIPGTAKKQDANYSTIEVISHVVLADFIVWVTSDSKVWACDTHFGHPRQSVPRSPPFEVFGYSSPSRKLQDIQGQFNKFAVFTDLDEVLAGDTDHLKRCADAAKSSELSESPSDATSPSALAKKEELSCAKPPNVEGLQHSHVINLAFGDHHYHALHANGSITSYGRDPQSVGALGLGSPENGGSFRGLRQAGRNFRPDLQLMRQAERRGRQIWFETEKRDWLLWLHGMLYDRTTHFDNYTLDPLVSSPGPIIEWMNEARQLMFSEWLEQEGKHWDDGPVSLDSHNQEDDSASNKHHHQHDDFHLDPYFTIAIAAAGWHSGALVLVDDDKVHETRQKWLTMIPSINDEQEQEDHNGKDSKFMPGHFETQPLEPEETYIWKVQGFPKVALPDGHELPGVGERRPWRDGMPTLAELGITGDTMTWRSEEGS